MLIPEIPKLITYKKITIYRQNYLLPVFHNRQLKKFQKTIKERRKLIQEGIRYHYYLGDIIKQKEKVTPQEIFIETQLLVKDYRFLINGLETYQESYYHFLLTLSHNLKVLFSQKYRELKLLDYERIKLEIKNSDNPKILYQLQQEKQENYRAILLLGKTSFLMLEKTRILGEGIKRIGEDTQKQKKIIQMIMEELKIYEELNEYQIKSQRVRQEILELAENTIPFQNSLQNYFSPFQLLIEEVIKVDEEFYATVGEIKYLIDNICEPHPEDLNINLEDSGKISEFFMDFMVTGYEKGERLKDAFFDSPLSDSLYNERKFINQLTPLRQTINQLSHYISEQLLKQNQLGLTTIVQAIFPEDHHQENDHKIPDKILKDAPHPLDSQDQKLSPIDYSELQEFLTKQSWEEADRQTTKLLLKIMGKTYWNEVYPEDIDHFPCAELRKIDQLWLYYSNSHFGFSIQQMIWSNVGGNIDYETKKKLGERLGWYKEGKWLNYEELNFQLSSKTPIGHLPAHWLIYEEDLSNLTILSSSEKKDSVSSWRVGNWLLWQMQLFLSKVEMCGLIPLPDI